ncbi:MAG: phosphoribosylanthranilate isomerase [Gammaproteobacteria bacterium]|nr:MAG: phosphoribosylanthranilate isomerase [Gammaproteobacteria bacterium]
MSKKNSRVRIKICGITDEKTAYFCAMQGVDAIGLVFYDKSPRHITLKKAIEIKNSLPPFMDIVALFMNENKDIIKKIQDRLQPDYLQFHGQESESFCNSFQQKYIKAIAMGDDKNGDDKFNDYDSSSGILLDSHREGQAGGSGKKFNWHSIAKLKNNIKKPLILAGGLKVENIKEAIKTIQPYAVDLSSGVESSKGIKSQKMIKDFVEMINK